MSLIKLPIRVQQQIKCYTQFALPLCVIFTEKKYHPWILKTFMQIKSAKKITKNGNHLQYVIDNAIDYNLLKIDYGDVLDVEHASWDKISSHIEFAKSKLDNGFYIHYQFDEFYLREKPGYGKSHFLHPSLIYGYSGELREFYAVGFIGATFKEFVIGFSEFEAASKNLDLFDKSLDMNSHKNRNIYFYKLKPADRVYAFDVADFKVVIREYLGSPEKDEWIHGLGGYKVALNNLITPYEPSCYLKYNTTHLLYEHKKIFILAIEYVFGQASILNKFSDLLLEYKQLVLKFELIRSLHMDEILSKGKGIFISTEETAREIHGKLLEAYEIEVDLVGRLLDRVNFFHPVST